MPSIGLTFKVVLARVRKDSNCSEGIVPVVSRMPEVQGTPETYGRFMGGSDQNTSNPGRVGQIGQFMQISQSRINTDYFACR